MYNNNTNNMADNKKERRLLSASSLCGDKVKNNEGEDLGEVKELMIDVNTGKVEYAVLSYGGIFGLGDKLFAVPWDCLCVNEQEKCFEMHVKKEQLENSPGFDKDSWPDQKDPDWEAKVKKYYQFDNPDNSKKSNNSDNFGQPL